MAANKTCKTELDAGGILLKCAKTPHSDDGHETADGILFSVAAEEVAAAALVPAAEDDTE